MYHAVVLQTLAGHCWVRLLDGPIAQDRGAGRMKLPNWMLGIVTDPPAKYVAMREAALVGCGPPPTDVPAVASGAVPPGSALAPAAPALPPAAPAASAPECPLEDAVCPPEDDTEDTPAEGAPPAEAAATPKSSPFTPILEMLQPRGLGKEL